MNLHNYLINNSQFSMKTLKQKRQLTLPILLVNLNIVYFGKAISSTG